MLVAVGKPFKIFKRRTNTGSYYIYAGVYQCECGDRVVASLKSGLLKRKYCGLKSCLKRKTHSNHPLYPTWRGMISRCTNPASVGWENYGARGITVCGRWINGDDKQNGFDCFVADMGERLDGHSIDRIDVNKGYSPDNCRWATMSEQSRNKRISLFPLTIIQMHLRFADGDSFRNISRELNLNDTTVRYNWFQWRIEQLENILREHSIPIPS